MRWFAAISIVSGLLLGLFLGWLYFPGSASVRLRSLAAFDSPGETTVQGDACHGPTKVVSEQDLQPLFAPLFVAEDHLPTQLARLHSCVALETKNLPRELQEVSDSARIRLSFRNVELSTIYLNLVYFGEDQWGAAAASEHYFGVPPSRLTISQAALLVGLAQSPSIYSPSKHPDRALARRNKIIQGELERLSISKEEAQAAMAAALNR